MEYIKTHEDFSNIALLAGRMLCEPVLSHQVENENFFEFKLEVERLSKIKDIIPVTISERVLSNKALQKGQFVRVCGEYRSYNKLSGEKSKLVLHLFAKEIEVLQQEEEFENEVKLTGFICKTPVYRKTPFNREICDILLAVNRTNYHKSDYVPCILWGRNARFIAEQKIGCKVEIVGRIQSREYVKAFEDGTSETKTAYEVSCQRIMLLSNITPLKNAEQEGEVLTAESPF